MNKRRRRPTPQNHSIEQNRTPNETANPSRRRRIHTAPPSFFLSFPFFVSSSAGLENEGKGEDLANPPRPIALPAHPPDAAKALAHDKPQRSARHDVLNLLRRQHQALHRAPIAPLRLLPAKEALLRVPRPVPVRRARPLVARRRGARDPGGRDDALAHVHALDLDVGERERHFQERDDLGVVRRGHDARDLHLARPRAAPRALGGGRRGEPRGIQSTHDQRARPRGLRVLRVALVAAVLRSGRRARACMAIVRRIHARRRSLRPMRVDRAPRVRWAERHAFLLRRGRRVLLRGLVMVVKRRRRMTRRGRNKTMAFRTRAVLASAALLTALPSAPFESDFNQTLDGGRREAAS